ncbi:MAG: GFA family protein [Anaerolineae bacterium]
MHTGHCLCRKIKFEISSALEPAVACHCEQCRRWTGHFLVGVEVDRDALTIQGEEHLKWFHSSEKVRRGFCSNCGSTLFFDPVDKTKHRWISVSMGAIEAPTHTQLGQHIFTAEKGDYYEITDGLPQNEY